MKSGIKTTEFWLVMVGSLVGGYATFYSLAHGTDARVYAIGIAVMNAIYTLARTLYKTKVK